MDLGIGGRLFIITGASSGLGRAVAEKLAGEGADLLVVGRSGGKLEELSMSYPGKIGVIEGDLYSDETLVRISTRVKDARLDGIFVNAGGPPAKSITETDITDWDDAYRTLLRWKVRLVKLLLPRFEEQGYGRILFSESSSVKQPVENLVLSTSLRLAVAGFSKTLAQEYAGKGITSNLIAPGYHDTAAVDRLFRKKSKEMGVSFEEARDNGIKNIPTGHLGDPAAFASLAAWLMSPLSSFVTGQVYALEGGAVKGTL